MHLTIGSNESKELSCYTSMVWSSVNLHSIHVNEALQYPNAHVRHTHSSSSTWYKCNLIPNPHTCNPTPHTTSGELQWLIHRPLGLIYTHTHTHAHIFHTCLLHCVYYSRYYKVTETGSPSWLGSHALTEPQTPCQDANRLMSPPSNPTRPQSFAMGLAEKCSCSTRHTALFWTIQTCTSMSDSFCCPGNNITTRVRVCALGSKWRQLSVTSVCQNEVV